MTGAAMGFQGTVSKVGKSILVARFFHAALRGGIRVAPFKPWNISNNVARSTKGR